MKHLEQKKNVYAQFQLGNFGIARSNKAKVIEEPVERLEEATMMKPQGKPRVFSLFTYARKLIRQKNEQLLPRELKVRNDKVQVFTFQKVKAVRNIDTGEVREATIETKPESKWAPDKDWNGKKIRPLTAKHSMRNLKQLPQKRPQLKQMRPTPALLSSVLSEEKLPPRSNALLRISREPGLNFDYM